MLIGIGTRRQAMPVTVTRFAPSPTGHLHLGHAYAALFAEQAAREHDGRFLLRIEDIDHGRCRAEFETSILEDLAWLGITWKRPARRQSEHMSDYVGALQQLEGMELLYPCFCTRRSILAEVERAGHAPHGPDGVIYPGTCRRLSARKREDRSAAGEAFVLRLNMAAAIGRTGPLTWYDRTAGPVPAEPEAFGDVVLARKDIPTSYHLAVTVDDALQGVSLVTRGNDLFAATHIHRLLQELLDLNVPEWHHHGILLDSTGRRMAKRDNPLTLRQLREAGHTPADVREMSGIRSAGAD
jgi:glutamyl-Q tRNA(Asp) synthetase